jgi:exodeoxyribonuclease VII large subunit
MEPLSVTQLSRLIEGALSHRFPGEIQVAGEIGEFKRSPAGHWHFSLVQARERISCVMFASRARDFHRLPSAGEVVQVWGRVELYAAQSKVTVRVRFIDELAASGQRAAALEKLRQLLAKQGLFAPELKRPLPLLPRRVGVVTSKSSAAWADVQRVVDRRFPGFPLVLADSPVQGEGAAWELVGALRSLSGRCDVVLLVRGGGAKEDLMVFNHEAVVRAVRACPVPVVTGIGHRTDQSFADLAADVVASTPSAAAERAVPVRADLVRRVEGLRAQLLQAVDRHVRVRRERVQRARLVHPRESLARTRQRLDALDQRLGSAMTRDLRRRQDALARAARTLDALSPLRVLGRGYALVRDDQGHVVSDAGELQVGQGLDLRFAQGSARVRVEETR